MTNSDSEEQFQANHVKSLTDFTEDMVEELNKNMKVSVVYV